MLIAITRPVSESLARCELTHLAREPIDVGRAESQHAAYEALLGSLGVRVLRTPSAPELPDAVFVEDAAVVLDEIAVVTRPGAESRRAETEAIAGALSAFRPLRTMTAPATLDGGDVLRLGRTLYVGRAEDGPGRTSDEGIAQLREIVSPFGYEVVAVAFSGCLHLKSAVSELTDDRLLVNPVWVPRASFPGFRTIVIDEREPHAANALRIGETVVFPSQYPRTCERLEREGLRLAPIAYDELAKAEGALTCCSLIFDGPPPQGERV